MKKKHQKHTDLSRPEMGYFGRREWAVIGTPCGNIQSLAGQVINALSPSFKLGYVDADHGDKAPARNGTAVEYTDKISFHRFDMTGAFDTYHFRPLFNNTDGVIVNGNHFVAAKQIVVVDPKKKDSLQRKLDRLTDVQLFLLAEGVEGPFDFLQEQIPGSGDIPVFHLKDTEAIIDWFRRQLLEAIPPVNGLVLAGGKSQRMGIDKSTLEYHGMPQRTYLLQLLNEFCRQTLLSCRPDQTASYPDQTPLVADTFTGLGPMGAILSAFRQQPDKAWLVVACDLPLLDRETISFLIENRNPSAVATCFKSPVNEFPEPLITIWEPRSYSVLLQFLAQGYSCPRKVLINSQVELLEAPSPDALRNVNTPEDLKAVKSML